ncbi:MAG: ferrous iron transport protein B [Solobacterium sp.]|nr:ferrous iron transport protein B [Solobacterium sp.]
MANERLKIALAGNPNSGKTTLFNALTGSNQYVGNWPGVTVEKKEGKLKKHPDVIIEDLPGIYSLSPYTLEEVVSRNYLIGEHPDAILNIVDGTNLERNLYLTTQLLEIGVPVVVAVNMMDLVKKADDKININALSEKLGCKIVEISALKETGIMEAAEAAIAAAEAKSATSIHKYEDKIETALSKITDAVLTDVPADQKRWYAIKVFERDEKVLARLNLNESKMAEVEAIVSAVEKDLDDDAESIITNARYTFITETLNGIYTKQNAGKLSVSDKIDNIVTNRWLGLPIFAVVMFIVYFVSIQTFGTGATDWVNDGLFGDGWFWFGLGRAEFDEDSGAYKADQEANQAFIDEAIEKGYISSSENDEGETEITVLKPEQLENLVVSADIHNDEGDVEETREVTYSDYEIYSAEEEPEAATYGPWQDGLPTVIGNFLKSIEVADWLQSLILNGIVAGVGSVLGFLPQMLVLFFFLAFLEGCGYMARIAFVMDRVFRKFGLSGKSFIPMLIGTGCGVPGVMASRTIENERDRRMTVMTTTFIPCSAKLPVIALIAGAFFQKSGLVATSTYFLGITAIVISGITLKKTKMFAGDPAPFVMELPAYHWPTPSNILHSMWERGSSFVKKAGTIILLATVLVWFMQSYGFTENGFGAVEQSESMLAAIGNAIKFIFIPLGWGDWRAAVAAITGLVAKENVVGTMGILYGAGEVAENGWQIFTSMANAFNNNPIAGYSFLAFNLLCAPCFAAIGAIRREMNNGKWTWFAIAYQCSLAYVIALIIYQVGSAVTGNIHPIGLVVAIVLIAAIIWGLVRPGYKEK